MFHPKKLARLRTRIACTIQKACKCNIFFWTNKIFFIKKCLFLQKAIYSLQKDAWVFSKKIIRGGVIRWLSVTYKYTKCPIQNWTKIIENCGDFVAVVISHKSHWFSRITTDLISCSPSGSRNLINLIAHFVRSMYSVINCLRSLFRHYANAMTNHRYAIKAHLILTNKSKYRLPLTMCTATFDKIKR